MTKSELREMIRECLREELKSNRLTEGHEVFDLGRGYYADIDMDQYELHPERINVEIYKDTTGWQNPHYDKYITTVRSVDEAREYIASLREELSLLEAVSIKDIKIGDRISYYLDVTPEERWEDALVVDISSNTITVLDPYGAFGETAKLAFSDLLDVEVTSGVWYDLKKLETDDYQNRNGDYPRSGRPDTIYVSDSDIEFSFKNTSQPVAERWVENYLSSKGFKVAVGALNSYQTGDYDDDWVDVSIAISKITTKAPLTESALTAEEKVDAWHAGTRRENYKAAGIPKLQTFLDIAKRKGYTEIVDIIEDEFIRRGITPEVSAPIATTSPASTSPTATSEVASDTEVSATDVEEPTEPPHFSDELVKDLETPVLSDKEKDILIGKAIDYLGKVAFYARSYWSTAMGFIGSYSTTWYNGNGNVVKPDRAKDKVRDLTYTSDRLIVLRSHFDGGSHNIDRYYSIEVPSSTKYIVDTDKIRKMMYSSYYDTEIDWRISTLTKTATNRKKFKQYLIDTAGMPADQAEALTTYAFDSRVW